MKKFCTISLCLFRAGINHRHEVMCRCCCKIAAIVINRASFVNKFSLKTRLQATLSTTAQCCILMPLQQTHKLDCRLKRNLFFSPRDFPPLTLECVCGKHIPAPPPPHASREYIEISVWILLHNKESLIPPTWKIIHARVTRANKFFCTEGGKDNLLFFLFSILGLMPCLSLLLLLHLKCWLLNMI